MKLQSGRASCLTAVFLGIALSLTADAGQKGSRSIDLTRSVAEYTVGNIVDQAVVNIGRRYNLNNDQLEKTGLIMKTRVNDFLKEHEVEVWPAIRGLLANRTPPENEADLKRLGASARRLAKIAHRAVKDGNAEWRKILTAEQKKTHDYDLAELDKTFAKMDQNFGAWENGQPTEDTVFPPRPRPTGSPAAGPSTPSRPPEGLPSGEKNPFELSVFDTFVERFIKEYELDKAQIEIALSILKETKAKAGDVMAKITAQRSMAIAEDDPKKRRAADAEWKKLIEPVYQLFAEMNGRLRGLLTTVQVERHHANAKDGMAKS